VAPKALAAYQEKLPELKLHDNDGKPVLGDRETDQFISGLIDRLRSAPAAISSLNPVLPQRPAKRGRRVLAALSEFFFQVRPHSVP